jgi:hypothetical protein
MSWQCTTLATKPVSQTAILIITRQHNQCKWQVNGADPNWNHIGKAIHPHAKTPCQFEQFILDYLHWSTQSKPSVWSWHLEATSWAGIPYSSSTAPSMPDSQPSPIYADAIFGMHAFWQNAAIGSILFQTYLAAQWRLPRNPLSILCHCCHQPLTPIPLRCPVQFNFQQESCNQDSLLSMGIITTSITSEKRKYIPEFSSLFHYKWRMWPLKCTIVTQMHSNMLEAVPGNFASMHHIAQHTPAHYQQLPTVCLLHWHGWVKPSFCKSDRDRGMQFLWFWMMSEILNIFID